MLPGLFLLLYLTGLVFAREPPGVKCMVVNLEYVHCTWNGQGTPEVNYTFQGRFHNDKEFSQCTTYISESSTVVGCNQTHQNLISTRFSTFYTKLVYGNDSSQQSHNLKSQVKLNPPVNVTVKNGSDSNLWFYWNHTAGGRCVETEVRHRRNYKNWENSKLSSGRQTYSINLPSSNSLYELEVRSTIADYCGESEFWSDWSQTVSWGSMKENNSTVTSRQGSSMSVWTPVLYMVGVLILVLLVMMLVQHERLRIILIPVVPNPGKNLDDILIHPNVEDWLHISKDLKEGFKANFNERPCPVREYSRVPHSASESSDSSTFSTTTDQTDFSISISANELDDLSSSCSSSTSTLPDSSDEGQIAV